MLLLQYFLQIIIPLYDVKCMISMKNSNSLKFFLVILLHKDMISQCSMYSLSWNIWLSIVPLLYGNKTCIFKYLYTHIDIMFLKLYIICNNEKLLMGKFENNLLD